MAFAIVDVVRMRGTPESRTALGNTAPVLDLPTSTFLASPLTYTVIARTPTFQKSVPVRSLTREEYCIRFGSGTSSVGWRPIPSAEDTRSEPGRERERERKREAGALSTGVMEKRLEAHAAPSGLLLVTGGMVEAMMELRGRAIPRIPLNLGPRGSFCTLLAAAGTRVSKRKKKEQRNVPIAWLSIV